MTAKWRVVAVALVIPFAVWQWAPGQKVVTSPAAVPSTQQSFYTPLIHELQGLAANPVRVEIPPTLEHWEAAFVAPYISLARGWERQLDTEYNSLFYVPGQLTAQSYEQWLAASGVTYVALPKSPLDYAATAEAALLRSGAVTTLRPVWHSSNWQLWRVVGSPGLVSGPGVVTALGPDHLTVAATGAGAITVRVRYTKFWSVESGDACVGLGPAGWTLVTAQSPGVVQLSASILHPAPRPGCAS
jgi:hypothetical protein